MANKKKIAAIGGVSVAAVAAVAAGAFAFFSDSADGQTSGVAGTVDASISNALELENAKNINPGDDDPKNPDDAREGTQHKLNFSVKNDGNKSIMTRNIITLSVKAGKDYEGVQSVGDVMNPAVYSLLVQKKGDGQDAVELVKKYYTTATDITDSSKYVEFTEKDTENLAKGVLPEGCTAIRYITQDVALNGSSATTEEQGREVEYDAEGNRTIVKEHKTMSGADINEEGDEVDYVFYLMLEHFANDTYELSNLTIDLEVQAMQYRNTNSDSWNTIFKDSVTAGGGTVTE